MKGLLNNSKTLHDKNNFIEIPDDTQPESRKNRAYRHSRPNGALNNPQTNKTNYSSLLDDIAETIDTPDELQPLSKRGSIVTRSMSSKQRAKGSSSTSGVAEDNNQPKRICATCHFELDGTESEMLMLMYYPNNVEYNCNKDLTESSVRNEHMVVLLYCCILSLYSSLHNLLS